MPGVLSPSGMFPEDFSEDLNPILRKSGPFFNPSGTVRTPKKRMKKPQKKNFKNLPPML